MRKSRRVLRLGLTINVILHWYKKYKYHNCYETQTDRIIESIQRALSDRSTGMSNRILHRKWKYSICCFRDVIEKIGRNISTRSEPKRPAATIGGGDFLDRLEICLLGWSNEWSDLDDFDRIDLVFLSELITSSAHEIITFLSSHEDNFQAKLPI